MMVTALNVQMQYMYVPHIPHRAHPVYKARDMHSVQQRSYRAVFSTCYGPAKGYATALKQLRHTQSERLSTVGTGAVNNELENTEVLDKTPNERGQPVGESNRIL